MTRAARRVASLAIAVLPSCGFYVRVGGPRATLPAVFDGVTVHRDEAVGRGVRMRLSPGNSLENLGFQDGDVLVSVEGREIEDLEDLLRAVSGRSAPADPPVAIVRRGERLDRLLPIDEGVPYAIGDFGSFWLYTLMRGFSPRERDRDWVGLDPLLGIAVGPDVHGFSLLGLLGFEVRRGGDWHVLLAPFAAGQDVVANPGPRARSRVFGYFIEW